MMGRAGKRRRRVWRKCEGEGGVPRVLRDKCSAAAPATISRYSSARRRAVGDDAITSPAAAGKRGAPEKIWLSAAVQRCAPKTAVRVALKFLFREYRNRQPIISLSSRRPHLVEHSALFLKPLLCSSKLVVFPCIDRSLA